MPRPGAPDNLAAAQMRKQNQAGETDGAVVLNAVPFRLGGRCGMVKAVVIADDLTGAADTGLQFHQQGLPAGVLLAGDGTGRLTESRSPDAAGRRWSAIILSTETRNKTEEDAGAVLEDVAARLSQTLLRPAEELSRPLLYKKIDS